MCRVVRARRTTKHSIRRGSHGSCLPTHIHVLPSATHGWPAPSIRGSSSNVVVVVNNGSTSIHVALRLPQRTHSRRLDTAGQAYCIQHEHGQRHCGSVCYGRSPDCQAHLAGRRRPSTSGHSISRLVVAVDVIAANKPPTVPVCVAPPLHPQDRLRRASTSLTAELRQARGRPSQGAGRE